MPPPLDDTPEASAHRENAAMAQIAATLSANAAVAELAVECVAARTKSAPRPRRAITRGGRDADRDGSKLSLANEVT